MPRRVVRRLEKAKVSVETGLIIAVGVLAALIFLVGYGNDYSSCLRSNSTRESANHRARNAADFWRYKVAAARRESSKRATERAAAVESAYPNSKLGQEFVRYLRLQSQIDRNAASRFTDYADGIERDLSPKLECSGVHPATR